MQELLQVKKRGNDKTVIPASSSTYTKETSVDRKSKHFTEIRNKFEALKSPETQQQRLSKPRLSLNSEKFNELRNKFDISPVSLKIKADFNCEENPGVAASTEKIMLENQEDSVKNRIVGEIDFQTLDLVEIIKIDKRVNLPSQEREISEIQPIDIIEPVALIEKEYIFDPIFKNNNYSFYDYNSSRIESEELFVLGLTMQDSSTNEESDAMSFSRNNLILVTRKISSEIVEGYNLSLGTIGQLKINEIAIEYERHFEVEISLKTDDPDLLNFDVGEEIWLLQVVDEDWGLGIMKSTDSKISLGLFPFNYVAPVLYPNGIN